MNPLPAEFFTRFGLYTEREFLTPEECASLRDEMRAATGAPATVAEGQRDAVDEAHRRTKQAEVSPTTAARIREKLLEAIPGLAKHFERRLVGMQAPQFLVYREGDFFRPHEDDSENPEAPDFVRQRSVSAVVFLATPGDPAGYSGGVAHVLRPDGRQSERRERRPSARGRDGVARCIPVASRPLRLARHRR